MTYKISYDPLWKTLVDRHMSKTEFTKAVGLAKGTVAKMGAGESVTLDVIGRICAELQCPISDVVEITTASPAQPSVDEQGKES